jgi:hypothetical protein
MRSDYRFDGPAYEYPIQNRSDGFSLVLPIYMELVEVTTLLVTLIFSTIENFIVSMLCVMVVRRLRARHFRARLLSASTLVRIDIFAHNTYG